MSAMVELERGKYRRGQKSSRGREQPSSAPWTAACHKQLVNDTGDEI